jgi:hypothetical protein
MSQRYRRSHFVYFNAVKLIHFFLALRMTLALIRYFPYFLAKQRRRLMAKV